MVALHLLRTDLGPVGHRLSEYANGEFGQLMTVAFVALGLGMVALGLGLLSVRRPGRWTWLVPAAIVVAGVGMIVAGAYPTDPLGEGTVAEAVHSRASGLASVLLIAAVAGSAVERGPGRLRPEPGFAGGLAVAAVVLGCLTAVLHDTTWSGFGQRLLWVTLLTWLFIAAWRLGRQPVASAV